MCECSIPKATLSKNMLGDCASTHSFHSSPQCGSNFFVFIQNGLIYMIFFYPSKMKYNCVLDCAFSKHLYGKACHVVMWMNTWREACE